MKQLVQPRADTTDGAGWCHRMARGVFGAPLVAGLYSATKAADATKHRHATRAMPNVAVPVWFDHDGDYDGTGVKNWGHVVVWIPGRGFLTSPWYLKHGQEWYSTIEDIERTFRAKFRFWSEDINGLRVAEPTSTPALPPDEIGEEMFIIKLKNGRWYLVVPNGAGKMRAFWLPGKSGASETGLPIFDYSKATNEHMKQLRAAVDGI